MLPGKNTESPFSERRLLELGVNLPDRQRLRDGWSKPILRQAMLRRMPEPVRLRCDKQHLGWRLTGRLWGRHEALPTLPQIAERSLPGLLNPTPPASDPLSPGHRWPRHLLQAIQLERWIMRTLHKQERQ